MRKIIELTIGLAMLTPGTAHAGDVWSIEGRCTELRASGHDLTAGCLGKVVNANSDRGRVSFIFSLKTGGLIAFNGDGNQQVNPTRSTATQPVNEVVFSIGIQGVPDNHLRAAGTCKYGDPSAGVMQISCSASTGEGDFSAKFTTNGKAPRPGY